MPKGASPKDRMTQRYSLLSRQLEDMPKDYSALTKLSRKVNEFLKRDNQLVTTQQRVDLEKKVKRIDKSLSANARKMSDKKVP